MKVSLRDGLLVLLFAGAAPIPQASGSDFGTLRSSGRNGDSVEAFRDGQTLIIFAHQDDDALWMLPFWPLARKFILAGYPAAPVFEDMVSRLPARLNYRERWVRAWQSVDNDIWADVFTDRCKRADIINAASMKAHLRPLLEPTIKRIVTHNNWGEYGHAQHRLVNKVVRELAVERGLDVWAIGMRVAEGETEQFEYANVARTLGLSTIEGYFDPALFDEVRRVYQSTKPTASTPELKTRFLQWSPTLWTWADEKEAYPMGWRPFVKLVDRGIDRTVGNAAVLRLELEIPRLNDCPTTPQSARP